MLSACFFNLYVECIMGNTMLDEAQAVIQMEGRNINNHRYANDTTLMAEIEEELEPLDENEKSEKVWLKLNIQKIKIIGIGPIFSWQTDGETIETVTDFICLGSKITAEDDCSHEIIPWKNSNDKTRQHIKKQRHYFAYKVCIVKAMVFLVVVYEFESWTIKKAEHQRTDAFKLWCWRKLLRVPWTTRRSNQSILKEINLKYSLEGLMLKLKLQYFGHMMSRANSLEKTLMLGKIEGRRRG